MHFSISFPLQLLFGRLNHTFGRLQPLLKRYAVRLNSGVLRKAATAVLSVLMFLGAVQVVELFASSAAQPFHPVFALIGPLEIVNSYGLFAVMTTSRPEIVFEGSNDGQTWKEYSFPYKPGEVKRSLRSGRSTSTETRLATVVRCA